MIRRFALLIIGILAISVLTWYVNDQFSAEPVPPTPRPAATPSTSQADRLMAFCDKARNQDNALCHVDPDDSEAVRDAVERIIERSSPQIIEREGDDDDDDPPPDVRIVVPPSGPTRAPASPTPTRTTPPPIGREIVIPELPIPPEIGDLIPELPPLLN